MKTRIHKGLSWLLSLCMVAMLFPMAAFAENAQFKDMPNNYATSALQAAVQNGLLKGSNGKLRPTANLTRAEMATILNHAFGAAEKSDISGYTDVPAGAWYANEMAMAVHMKTLVGSGKSSIPTHPSLVRKPSRRWLPCSICPQATTPCWQTSRITLRWHLGREAAWPLWWPRAMPPATA